MKVFRHFYILNLFIMNHYYLDEETRLPDECFIDIDRLQVEDWNEARQEELFDRYKYHYEKEMREMTDKEFWKFAFNDQEWEEEVDEPWYNLYYKKIKTIKRLKELREREEMTENLLEEFEWSEPEFINYLVDIYIRD